MWNHDTLSANADTNLYGSHPFILEVRPGTVLHSSEQTTVLFGHALLVQVPVHPACCFGCMQACCSTLPCQERNIAKGRGSRLDCIGPQPMIGLGITSHWMIPTAGIAGIIQFQVILKQVIPRQSLLCLLPSLSHVSRRIRIVSQLPKFALPSG